MKFDYFIIGQGIAGSVMALELHKRGKKVMIISKENLSASSAVAAGIYNPFNFRRSIPTWHARIACPLASEFYSHAENITHAQFHVLKKIIRIFGDAEEQVRWKNYLAGDDVAYASGEMIDADIADKLIAPFGMGILTGGGVLNTASFMYAVKEYFSARNEYRDEAFAGNIEFSNDEITYEDKLSARKIIFCEGHLAAENPFFPNLPIAPSKGEMMHVSIPGLNLDDVINGPVYLAPLGNDLYTCGATYAPGKSDERITEDARAELITKLESMIRLPFRSESQFAGVRPAGRDRKPLVGTSRSNPNIAIFNGMSSKGVLLAPYLAKLLADHLENGAELPYEISLSRFKAVV